MRLAREADVERQHARRPDNRSQVNLARFEKQPNAVGQSDRPLEESPPVVDPRSHVDRRDLLVELDESLLELRPRGRDDAIGDVDVEDRHLALVTPFAAEWSDGGDLALAANPPAGRYAEGRRDRNGNARPRPTHPAR